MKPCTSEERSCVEHLYDLAQVPEKRKLMHTIDLNFKNKSVLPSYRINLERYNWVFTQYLAHDQDQKQLKWKNLKKKKNTHTQKNIYITLENYTPKK